MQVKLSNDCFTMLVVFDFIGYVSLKFHEQYATNMLIHFLVTVEQNLTHFSLINAPRYKWYFTGIRGMIHFP